MSGNQPGSRGGETGQDGCRGRDGCDRRRHRGPDGLSAQYELFALIGRRHDHGLPTIITSNYSLGETAARLAGDADPVEGDRIAWRIQEMGEVIEVRGRNLRAPERPGLKLVAGMTGSRST